MLQPSCNRFRGVLCRPAETQRIELLSASMFEPTGLSPLQLLLISPLHFRPYRILIHHLDDGGSTHLWNVGMLQRDCTALYHRRLSYSYSPPRELKISFFYSVWYI
jgi:hypothetical protein